MKYRHHKDVGIRIIYAFKIVVTNAFCGISKIPPAGTSCGFNNDPKNSMFPPVGASKIAQCVSGAAAVVQDSSASTKRKAGELLNEPVVGSVQFVVFDVISYLA